MTKTELIACVAEKTGKTRREVKEVVDITLGVIGDRLKDGGQVTIQDFGRFSVIRTKERKVRLPNTGEMMVVPPKEKVRFNAYEGITYYSQKTF